MYKIIVGDCLESLNNLPSESINCCVTSPPYWGLRDYGVSGQIGLEESPEQYIDKMVEVFGQVNRVLRNDGTLWLNLGDSYAGSGKGAWNNKNGGQKEVYIPDSDSPQTKIPKIPSGLKAKDLVGIPWLVAFALRANGWYLRSDIIWHKPNQMPSSVKDRPTLDYEHLFLLAKSEKYFFDKDAIAEPSVNEGVVVSLGKKSFSKRQADGKKIKPSGNGNASTYTVKPTRNKRSVWSITTKPYREAHFATFPPELVEPCILAGCQKDGTVLDPFCGSGTTGVVALRHGRNFIGLELNPEYAELSRKRITESRIEDFLSDL